MNEIASLIAASLSAGTPLAIAGLGLLINEKVGVLNLGAEGMLLVGAVTGFAVAFHTHSVVLALLGGAAAAAVVAAVFGWLVIWINANQYATGLAVSLFGGGFSAFVGVSYVGQKLGDPVSYAVPVLGDIPFIGPALFRQHPMVYLTVLAVAAVAWFFYRTRAGLVLRAVGESPESAHALGYKVRLLRLAAVLAGGWLCG
ncbi:MAG: ABC transporter permease, partial [Burkholderiales bacterium PBB5]